MSDTSAPRDGHDPREPNDPHDGRDPGGPRGELAPREPGEPTNPGNSSNSANSANSADQGDQGAKRDSSDPRDEPDPGDPQHPHRRIRSFVLRAGRIGPGQARALAELGPRFVLPFQAEPIDPEAVFGRRAPLVLEIGFGMGDATARIAAARPDTDFLGCEVHEPGVGALLRRIDELGLANLRIVQHDAVEVLERMVAPASLAGIHVFFPDPWHKKKHHKRRLIQPPFVARLVTRLAPGGTLHCATDWEPYAQQMLEVLSAEPALANSAEAYAPRPDYRPLTKFEQRGLRLGHGVWDLVFVRRADADSSIALPA